jgi:hypothetical protein
MLVVLLQMFRSACARLAVIYLVDMLSTPSLQPTTKSLSVEQNHESWLRLSVQKVLLAD